MRHRNTATAHGKRAGITNAQKKNSKRKLQIDVKYVYIYNNTTYILLLYSWLCTWRSSRHEYKRSSVDNWSHNAKVQQNKVPRLVYLPI